MDDLQTVLSNAGLGILCDVFHREKISVSEINNLSEAELNNLGVVTMGDRHRLKSAARRHIDTGSGSTNSTEGSLRLNLNTNESRGLCIFYLNTALATCWCHSLY